MRGTNKCDVESSLTSFSLCKGKVRQSQSPVQQRCYSSLFLTGSGVRTSKFLIRLLWSLDTLTLWNVFLICIFSIFLPGNWNACFSWWPVPWKKCCNNAVLLLKCGWAIFLAWSNISLPPKKAHQLHFCSITVVQEHFFLLSFNHPCTRMPLSCLEATQGKPFKTRVKEFSSTVV